MAIETLDEKQDVDELEAASRALIAAARVPHIRTRPHRGPKGDKSGGFLMATCKPLPVGHLPEEFALPVRDDAMEPLLSRGEEAIFSTVETPDAGHCVLIGTEFGPDIRQYEPVSETEWAGRALNTDYEDIETSQERAWIIAVLVGVRPSAQPTYAATLFNERLFVFDMADGAEVKIDCAQIIAAPWFASLPACDREHVEYMARKWAKH